jgi:hypothetical protein
VNKILEKYRLGLILLGLAGLFIPCTLFGHALFDNPAGSFELQWKTSQIKRSFATGVFNTMGLRVDNDPSVARVVELDGDSIIKGIALAFDVDDDFAFDTDEDIVAEIDIDVSGLSDFYIAYDRNGGPDGRRKVRVPEGASGWQTIEVVLDRARFANRGFAGTDFVISSGIDMATRVLVIRDIRFSRKSEKPLVSEKSGRLNLLVVDSDSGHPLTVQVGIYDSGNRMPLPSDGAVELQIFDQFTRTVEVREELDNLAWPHANRYSFYIEGSYRAVLPPGEYQLVVVKGPEYAIETRTFKIAAGGVTNQRVDVRHSMNMPQRGWYSGDVHNHFSRPNGSYNSNHMVHAQAHDVHMHWLHELGNSVTTHFQQFAWGEAGQYRDGNYYLGSGQEDPRTDYLGHMLMMGQSDRVRKADKYLRYDQAAASIQDLGGIAGIAHMDFAQFWQDVALALLAPDGLVNFVEVMQYNTVNTRDWYRFLNMGFKLPAAAGSDWPYMSLPGTVRTYVSIDQSFTPARWNDSLKSGKSFVSNGPMLEFAINGQPVGSELTVTSGEKLRVRARVSIEPSWDRLAKLELIRNGEIIATTASDDANGATELVLSAEVDAGTGAWFAVHATGLKSRDIVFQTPYTMRTQAHSSPIYVSVEGGPSCDPQTAANNMAAVIERLQWFKTAKYARNDNEAWESPDQTEKLVDTMRPVMHEWVDEKIDWYTNRKQELEALAH